MVVTKKEVDLSTLYEDPFFDLIKKAKKKKRTFRDGKASITFGAVPENEPEEPEPDHSAPATTAATSQAPTQAQTSQGAPAEPPSKTNAVVKAADDVDAAQNFFGEEGKKKPAAKPENSGKIAQLEREKKQLMERLEIVKNQ